MRRECIAYAQLDALPSPDAVRIRVPISVGFRYAEPVALVDRDAFIVRHHVAVCFCDSEHVRLGHAVSNDVAFSVHDYRHYPYFIILAGCEHINFSVVDAFDESDTDAV